MARGKPALWSALFGGLFVAAGVYVSGSAVPYNHLASYPLFALGALVVVGGLYVHAVAPEEPQMHDGETVTEKFHPTLRVAFVKLLAGVVLLGVGGYLLVGTQVPYAYPFACVALGAYVFAVGLWRFWANSLTTYYVTSNRFIKSFRFLGNRRRNAFIGDVRGVEASRGFLETLLGIGHVQIATAGKTAATVIKARNIPNPDELEEFLLRGMNERQ
ncbi:PH domain-containing protein [Halorussus sp. MSC15.2]|uniref:PH domain-containing protein n=1 Tax=Halorussus sp. MSC15.2 TaxID=2283638 RepID=UPI0013D5186C|nr:PH domain-containing protein [Halorussus sp. MSC15.2]NEU57868.1 PH domain-containing protein [Halorussus sp. MSC15.2]